MSFFSPTIRHLSLKPYRLYILLFVASVIFFSYLQVDRTFADPDSFYHAKITTLLAERGLIKELPWLSATGLSSSFTDHHFLYHLILIPFVIIFPPLIGLKVATVFLASLAILTLFWFLRQINAKGAFWYALFLLTVGPFIFRLNLAKAQPLVLIFLFIFIYLLFHRRYLLLILLSCLYVWLYAGWPLLILLALIYGAISILIPQNKKSWLVLGKSKLKVWRQSFKLVFSVCLGVAAGIFFSPYFPGNLEFYWQQSFKIAIFNYQYFIDVGAEWYPYVFSHLLLAAIPFFALFVVGCVAFIVSVDKQPANSWFLLIITFLFFILTLKSRRYIEYFVPIAVCFSAISLSIYWEKFGEDIRKILPRKFIYFFPAILFLGLLPVFVKDAYQNKQHYQNGMPFTKFEETSKYLEKNSEPGDIVFHGDWDEFPLLFYHNDKNYYITGLDSTFMYDYDMDLYNRWLQVVLGEDKESLHEVISGIFGAKYVFVDTSQSKSFDKNLANNIYFEEVLVTPDSKVYRVNK